MEAAKEAQTYERDILIKDEIELINKLKEKGPCNAFQYCKGLCFFSAIKI